MHVHMKQWTDCREGRNLGAAAGPRSEWSRQWWRVCGAETWILTMQLTYKVCRANSKLLCMVLNVPWTGPVINTELYGGLPQANDSILCCRLHFAGHAVHCTEDRYQALADLVFWQGSGSMRREQSNRRTLDTYHWRRTKVSTQHS